MTIPTAYLAMALMAAPTPLISQPLLMTAPAPAVATVNATVSPVARSPHHVPVHRKTGPSPFARIVPPNARPEWWPLAAGAVGVFLILGALMAHS